MTLEATDELIPAQTSYRLAPSVTTFKVRKLPSGAYSPSAISLSCGITVNEAGVITNYPDRTTPLDGYRIFFRARTRSNQTWSSTYSSYADEHSAITGTSLLVATYDAVEFVLCTNTSGFEASAIQGKIDSVVVDVTSDGADGAGAASLALTPDRIEVNADKNGKCLTAVSTNVSLDFTVGGVRQSEAAIETITNSLQGVTITNNTTSFTVAIAANTTRGLYDGNVKVVAKLVLDGVTYRAYANLRISPNRCGADGTKTETIYLSNTGTTPARPTGDSPSGWSTVKTAISSTVRYRWVSVRSSTDGGTTWSEWSLPVIDAYLSKDGTSFTVKGSALAVLTGSQTPGTVVTNPSTGDIVLHNDQAETTYDLSIYTGTSWSNGQMADANDGYILPDGHLWVRTSVTTWNARWKDCGQIKGDKGDPGDDAVVYQLLVVPAQVVCDVDGNPKVASLSVTKKKTTGSTPSTVTSFAIVVYNDSGVRLGSYSTTSSAITLPLTAFSDEKYLRIADATTNQAPDITVPIVYEQRGKTGRGYYPAGIWDALTEYRRSDTMTPIVLHESTFWELVADYSLNDEPSDSATSIWREAENFSVIFTQALFAAFAKLGSFVVSGDYFISQYGTLFVNGSKVAVKGTRTQGYVYMRTDTNGFRVPYYAATSDEGEDMPIYMYFQQSDPMAESTSPAFRPMKCIDGRVGEEWFAEGKAHVHTDGSLSLEGTVRATNFYQGVCIYGCDDDPMYYCLSKSAIEGEDYEDNFSVGQYYSLSDIYELSGSDLGQAPTGFVLNSHGASIVVLVNRYNNYGTRYVNLPRPEDFPGKVVEFVDNAYTNNGSVGSIYITEVAGRNVFVGMVGSSSLGYSDDHVTHSAGDKVRLYSLLYGGSYYWLDIT